MKIIVLALVFTILASIVDSREIYRLQPNLRRDIAKTTEMPYYGSSEEYGDSEEYGEVTETNSQEEVQTEDGLTSNEKDYFGKTFSENLNLVEFIKNSEESEEYEDGEEEEEVTETNSQKEVQTEDGLTSIERDFWEKTVLEYVNFLKFLKNWEISKEYGDSEEHGDSEENGKVIVT